MKDTYHFLALGDLHLTTGPRNDDRLAVLDWVISDATLKTKLNGGTVPDAWLWPGDISHSGLTIALRNALVERVRLMASVAPVVIVRGNHDPEGDLDFLAHLRADWPIVVVNTPQTIQVELPGGAILSLFCLPYPTKASLVGAGVPHEQLNSVVGQALRNITIHGGDELRRARDRGEITGVLGHVTIAGAVASVGQPQIGTDLEIDATHLNDFGPSPETFKVFNHIHKFQNVMGAFYCGSLCRLDWGEVEPKGYLEIFAQKIDMTDISAGHAVSSQWVQDVFFHNAPVPPMYHVEGTLTREGLADWRVTKGPNGLIPRVRPLAHLLVEEIRLNSDWWIGCDLRVRASYPQSEREVLTHARELVAAQFPGVRRFEFEPVAIPERALRAPEVVQAQTLHDKLIAWARVSGVSWSDQLERCADQLENALDDDAIIASVQHRVDEITHATVTA